ncbi:hypothetical protein K501DRAFT_284733 [Backusella circina FSU 941]|nr:hypothetical protein K501DRAFT_284733 [Backusella circina FSU 941]
MKRTQGLKDSRTQGLKDSRTQGLKDSRTQGIKIYIETCIYCYDQYWYLPHGHAIAPHSVRMRVNINVYYKNRHIL